MYSYAKEIDSRRKLKVKKKVLSVVLAAMCVVSMAACGSSNKSSDSSKGESKDKLVMATNAEFPPYEFYEGDEIVGIDAEFAKAIADKLGAELSIEDMAFDSVVAAVQSGKAQVGVAGLSVTPDREKNVAFTDSYATSHQVIIVRNN